MDLAELNRVASAMVAPGKGLLAADESSGTIKKRFDAIGAESTPVNRRDYREMLFSATEAMRNHISGVILYDETIRQTARDGRPLAELIRDAGSIPGIKVDEGAKEMAFRPGEKVTEGLDGLRERLKEYHGLGARFAKWRGVIDIADHTPSWACIKANAHALARYAALCQEADIVPIVEPEVLMDGDHTIERCYEVTEATLESVFNELFSQRVVYERMLLKPNMVISGNECSEQAGPKEVAEATIRCFRSVVPAAVPGIVFLSGGQSDEQATENLNAINAGGPHPWQLSFSYGRALQAPSLKAWRGDEGNVRAGQDALAHRARLNGAARDGSYTPDMEKVPTAA
jgi:fructose-bisphosphate aldolase class I